MKQYDHLIEKNIHTIYKRRLFSPVIYLILLLVLWIYSPIQDLAFPVSVSQEASLSTLKKKHIHYIRTTLTDLKFTGYTQTHFGVTTGYYYYIIQGKSCTLVLLNPGTCEEGLPTIDHLSLEATLVSNSSDFPALTEHLSKDLAWTQTGIHSSISSIIISEPGMELTLSRCLLAFFLFSGLYALICIILFAMYSVFPLLSPACRQLGLYGKAAQLLDQAEEELATLPQLATEDMFITEHFFIAFANKGVTIIPIQEILWIYKYSTLHKFLWYHFSISYTLHITANKHLYIQFPKNMKSDIDGIMDYLAEANHHILVGFNEKNRLAVQEIDNITRFSAHLLAILKFRI